MNRTQYINDWNKIAQMAEDNPDLSYIFIRDILISLEESAAYQLEEYQFAEGYNTVTIKQTRLFGVQKKKLSANQLQALDMAIKDIEMNPALGERMQGGLKDINVLEFEMRGKDVLLAYQLKSDAVILYALSTHELLYRLGTVVIRIAVFILDFSPFTR